MSKSCGHELTEILDARERVDGSGVVLMNRVEACRMCGQRRAVTREERRGVRGTLGTIQIQCQSRSPPGPGVCAVSVRFVACRDKAASSAGRPTTAYGISTIWSSTVA